MKIVAAQLDRIVHNGRRGEFRNYSLYLLCDPVSVWVGSVLPQQGLSKKWAHVFGSLNSEARNWFALVSSSFDLAWLRFGSAWLGLSWLWVRRDAEYNVFCYILNSIIPWLPQRTFPPSLHTEQVMFTIRAQSTSVSVGFDPHIIVENQLWASPVWILVQCV